MSGTLQNYQVKVGQEYQYEDTDIVIRIVAINYHLFEGEHFVETEFYGWGADKYFYDTTRLERFIAMIENNVLKEIENDYTKCNSRYKK